MSDARYAGETGEFSNPASPPDDASGFQISTRTGGAILTDLRGNIQKIDHGAAVLFRTAAHRLIGRSLTTLAAPGYERQIESLRETAFNLQAVVEGVLLFQQRQGEMHPVAVSVNRVIEDGQLTGLHWLLRQAEQTNASETLPITTELANINQKLQIELAERQKAEAATAKRERELLALHQATTALLSTLDLQGLLGQILDAATSAIPSAEKGMVYLIARDTGQLQMRAAIGYSDPRIQKINQPESGGYVARAVQGRHPLLIRDVQREPSLRYNGNISEIRAIQSVIVAPLIHPSAQVLGALSLESPRPTAFDDDDLRLLTSFAATATTAIYNAQLHAEVQKLAITDALTGLYNRRGFEELGRRELERLRRFSHPLSAMMVDVDYFKKVNDMHGHRVGDLVIRAVSKRLVSSLREVDIIGRFGGDEFTILLPETDLFTAVGVADRTLTAVSELPIIAEQTALKLTVSIGVVKAAPNVLNLDALIEQADQAMYAAKQGGRNQVHVGAWSGDA
jgi:diguanylate cyclase (GGDEF)-like protein/PAS domain S-box-containing protein